MVEATFFQPEFMPDIVSTPDNTPAGDCPVDFAIGDVLDGRYRVESVLGSGGMGVVYRVTQMFVDKEFALKTLAKGQISEVKIRRFQQEARAVFALDHPNIVAVKDFGIIEDMTPFLVMELITGETLSEILKRSGRLTLEQVIPIFVQTCFGLGYAHDEGIVHRDIKPSNIMVLDGIEVGAEGSIKILDFGIAKFAQHEGGEIQSLTRTGEIFGSPYYMSPEQCAGERVDHRADVYSLGCVLFEALTGTPPCVGESALSTMMQHQIGKTPTLKEASMGLDFPPELEKIVAKMLDKTPSRRYQKLGIVAHHLAALKRNTDDSEISGKSFAGSERKDVVRSRKTEKLIALDAAKESAKVDAGLGVDDVGSDTGAHAQAKVTSLPIPKVIALLCAATILSGLVFGGIGYLIGRAQPAANSDSSKVDTASNEEGASKQKGSESPSEDSQPKISVSNAVAQSTAVINHPKFEMIPPVAPTPVLNTPRQNTVFSFPKDISIGILKVDDEKPKSILGTVHVGKNSKLTLYTRHASLDCPKLLDTFRADDLNGLEAVFGDAVQVLKRVRNWKRLENLTFFDSLIKAVPGAHAHDETPLFDALLPEIDKMKNLTCLGLCNTNVTGRAVAKMSLLRSLHTLKLKRVYEIEPLLKVLPQHANIEELWLIEEGTDNRQLEMIAEMPNLQSLTIRRSRLNPDSLPIFLRMKKLKHLTIDRNTWSEQDIAKFKRSIPGCRFEPVFDIQYWYLLANSSLKQLADLSKESEQTTDDNHDASVAKQPLSPKALLDSKVTSSSAKADFEETRGEFGIADKYFQNKGSSEVDYVQLVLRPEVVEELGATRKEAAMMLDFPYKLIRPHEKEFVERLKPYLKGPTYWSHR